MSHQTRAQGWSRRAHASVRAQRESAGAPKYCTSCRKMPGLVHQSGLLQALVFQMARDVHGATYVRDLARAYFADEGATADRLVEEAQQASVVRYLALTRDVIEVAVWFRRFADIELDEEGDDAG